MTGVQRYSYDLVDALSRSGLEFQCGEPKRVGAGSSTLWEQLYLPRVAKDYDTLFCPANMGPLLLDSRVRLVVTLHCLRFRFHPENYSTLFVQWYRLMIPRILERADAVLTVSQATESEINRVYPQSLGKTHVVYPGVSSVFTSSVTRGDPQCPASPYFVYVGNNQPAKNVRAAIEAIGQLKGDAHLVLLGVSPDEFNSMNTNTTFDRIHALGHIQSAERVASIYRNAIALLSPSVYESFDLPTIEAMASGCPVIASDIPVHHEICGDAAWYVPSDRPDLWANSMKKIIDKPALANELKAKGRARAEIYSWSTAAQQVTSILKGPMQP